MLENIDVAQLAEQYALPWAINIGFALAIFIVGRIVVGIIVKILRKIFNRMGTDPILANFVCSIASALLTLVVVIAALQRLGVDTTSLVALIGAAGLAIGLSLQDSLKNFAAGVMIILFRPFKTGDFVEVSGISGTVEDVSIFSSRLRTGDNRQIIVPNGAIYGDNIINYSAKATRRIDLVFGIGYDDDLLKAKNIIADIMAADERILKDPEAGIAVGELADSSVNINTRPWVKSGDYWAVRADLLEKIKLAFDEQGISIPYPQMDIHTNAG